MLTLGMAVVLALSLQQPPATPPAAPPKPAELKLTVTPDRADLVVGDELQVEATLANGTDKDVELAELAFDERSLVFEIDFDAGPAKKKFTFGVIRPDAHLAERLALPRIALKAGKSLNGFFRIPALSPGSLVVTGVYKGADKELRAAAVTVSVKPRADGEAKLAAVLETSLGDFRIDLKPEEAPNTVANFISLARRGFFRNLNFHRVVKNEWIQSGCPYDSGYGSVGYSLKSEAGTQTAVHEAGSVSMSGHMKEGFTGSQFFVCMKRSPAFDRKFTIIGTVSGEGLDIVRKIGAVDVDKTTDRPKEDVKLKDIKILVVK